MRSERKRRREYRSSLFYRLFRSNLLTRIEANNRKRTKRKEKQRRMPNCISISASSTDSTELLQSKIEESPSPNMVSQSFTLDEKEIKSRPEESCYIPTENKDYYEKEYWEQRFAEEETYDWLLTYVDIREIINELIPPCAIISQDGKDQNVQNPRILMVGCGNSTLSADMYDDGYTNITNIDYSINVIQKMKSFHEEKRPKMSWLEMDMTNLDFGSCNETSFDVIFDKAAMDALCTCEGSVWNP